MTVPGSISTTGMTAGTSTAATSGRVIAATPMASTTVATVVPPMSTAITATGRSWRNIASVASAVATAGRIVAAMSAMTSTGRVVRRTGRAGRPGLIAGRRRGPGRSQGIEILGTDWPVIWPVEIWVQEQRGVVGPFQSEGVNRRIPDRGSQGTLVQGHKNLFFNGDIAPFGYDYLNRSARNAIVVVEILIH